MWFLFVLVPAASSALGALFSLTGGMGFVVAAAATSELHRRKGYRPDEGQFTERANNQYYGVKFDESSDFDINRNLGRLSRTAKEMLRPYAGKQFDMTKSEESFLRTLVESVLPAVDDFEVSRQLAEEQSYDDASIELLFEMADKVAVLMIPVVRWLDQFPRTRVKDAS